MALGLNLAGAHAAAALDIRFRKQMARRAEAAKFHFMFWADAIAMRSSAKDEEQLSYDSRIDVFEPLTLLAALSAMAKQLGLAALAPSFGDLPGYPLDGPLPPMLADSNALKSSHAKLANCLEGRAMTIRDLLRAPSAASGHHIMTGTTESIADVMDDWLIHRGMRRFQPLERATGG
ncbi:LLM class flavin-dependent oxidoreductase [Teichococcus oryzae]|uniref:LLM class flavin-dependent oxidoreductase n=1 Tax=Teichococcus oryzae TaxID=1608942 RepID=A0A5B2TC33_9PROT|nr:LLM class flavin-dependent oxidoreductase [Pseudoroseomonas oryzae]KAA2211643.1 LLM class flavin-dependent oxidoreductase [Pseudoroseomonas oryzae]